MSKDYYPKTPLIIGVDYNNKKYTNDITKDKNITNFTQNDLIGPYKKDDINLNDNNIGSRVIKFINPYINYQLYTGPDDMLCDILLVGGGGGGSSGAGGGGGVVMLYNQKLYANKVYNIRVGRGGIGRNSIITNGDNGYASYIYINGETPIINNNPSDSYIKTILAYGGGGGYANNTQLLNNNIQINNYYIVASGGGYPYNKKIDSSSKYIIPYNSLQGNKGGINPNLYCGCAGGGAGGSASADGTFAGNGISSSITNTIYSKGGNIHSLNNGLYYVRVYVDQRNYKNQIIAWGDYWGSDPSDKSRTPTHEGAINSIDNTSLTNSEERIAVYYSGYFFTQNYSGTFYFRTGSDDDSYLWIEDTMIVNNGGLHGFQWVQGSYNMKAYTYYRFRTLFRQNWGGTGFVVQFTHQLFGWRSDGFGFYYNAQYPNSYLNVNTSSLNNTNTGNGGNNALVHFRGITDIALKEGYNGGNGDSGIFAIRYTLKPTTIIANYINYNIETLFNNFPLTIEQPIDINIEQPIFETFQNKNNNDNIYDNIYDNILSVLNVDKKFKDYFIDIEQHLNKKLNIKEKFTNPGVDYETKLYYNILGNSTTSNMFSYNDYTGLLDSNTAMLYSKISTASSGDYATIDTDLNSKTTYIKFVYYLLLIDEIFYEIYNYVNNNNTKNFGLVNTITLQYATATNKGETNIIYTNDDATLNIYLYNKYYDTILPTTENRTLTNNAKITFRYNELIEENSETVSSNFKVKTSAYIQKSEQSSLPFESCVYNMIINKMIKIFSFSDYNVKSQLYLYLGYSKLLLYYIEVYLIINIYATSIYYKEKFVDLKNIINKNTSNINYIKFSDDTDNKSLNYTQLLNLKKKYYINQDIIDRTSSDINTNRTKLNSKIENYNFNYNNIKNYNYYNILLYIILIILIILFIYFILSNTADNTKIINISFILIILIIIIIILYYLFDKKKDLLENFTAVNYYIHDITNISQKEKKIYPSNTFEFQDIATCNLNPKDTLFSSNNPIIIVINRGGHIDKILIYNNINTLSIDNTKLTTGGSYLNKSTNTSNSFYNYLNKSHITGEDDNKTIQFLLKFVKVDDITSAATLKDLLDEITDINSALTIYLQNLQSQISLIDNIDLYQKTNKSLMTKKTIIDNYKKVFNNKNKKVDTNSNILNYDLTYIYHFNLLLCYIFVITLILTILFYVFNRGIKLFITIGIILYCLVLINFYMNVKKQTRTRSDRYYWQKPSENTLYKL